MGSDHTVASDTNAGGGRVWVRAVVLAIMVSGLTTLFLLLIPHWLLTQLLMISRGARVALATSWVAMCSGLLLWIAWRISLPRRAPRQP